MAFSYKNGRLHCDGVDLLSIEASFGTPVYVYSESILKRNASVLKDCFIDRGFKVSYAMKANANPKILELSRSFGIGVDIVSSGEFKMAQHVGFQGDEINFAGVGKTAAELDLALESEIDHFNVESRFELDQLESRAAILGPKSQSPAASESRHRSPYPSSHLNWIKAE